MQKQYNSLPERDYTLPLYRFRLRTEPFLRMRSLALRLNLSLLVAIALLFGANAAAQTDEDRLKQLQTELNTLNARLKNFQGERDSVEKALQEQERQLSRLHRDIFEIDKRIEANETELTQLEQNASTLERDRADQENQLRKDLSSMYQAGTEEPLKMILNQDNPAEFSRMLTYYQYLLNARAERIDTYLDTIRNLSQTRTTIVDRKTELTALKANYAAEQASLAIAQDKKADLLRQINSRILSAEEEIGQKEMDRAELETLIKEVQERITSLAPPEQSEPFGTLKGQYLSLIHI